MVRLDAIRIVLLVLKNTPSKDTVLQQVCIMSAQNAISKLVAGRFGDKLEGQVSIG
jgi:hypothetical protein